MDGFESRFCTPLCTYASEEPKVVGNSWLFGAHSWDAEHQSVQIFGLLRKHWAMKREGEESMNLPQNSFQKGNPSAAMNRVPKSFRKWHHLWSSEFCAQGMVKST